MPDEPQPIPVLEYRTPAPQPLSSQIKLTLPFLHALNWAAFLGASWTWCIGMFLPVLLIRDYGPTTWWVFAAPNVIGAAAMGWMLRGERDSGVMEDAHRPAALAFSVITIAFHVFFTGWLIRSLCGALALPYLSAISVIFFIAFRVWRGADRMLSWIALGLSLVLIHQLTGMFENGNAGPRDFSSRAAFDPMFLALVCAYGFALCPYLDLTFHRARRAVDSRAAKVAFGLGFGAFFISMIYLTTAYVVPLRYVLKDGYYNGAAWILPIIAVHLLAQSALTVSLHAREIAERWQRVSLPVWAAVAIILIAAGTIGASINNLTRWYGLNSGEVIYRVVMGFYGLIFPTYVWLCIIPGGGRVKPTQRQLIVLGGAVLVALPMFWLGFIQQRMIWLLPGLAVVLLARLILPARATLVPAPGS
jgi:hypothetical protein